MKEENKGYYKTKDLGEASALLAKNASLVKLERKDSMFFFVFADNVLCKKLGNQYWFGGLLVNARDMSEKLKTLKSRIFNSP